MNSSLSKRKVAFLLYNLIGDRYEKPSCLKKRAGGGGEKYGLKRNLGSYRSMKVHAWEAMNLWLFVSFLGITVTLKMLSEREDLYSKVEHQERMSDEGKSEHMLSSSFISITVFISCSWYLEWLLCTVAGQDIDTLLVYTEVILYRCQTFFSKSNNPKKKKRNDF